MEESTQIVQGYACRFVRCKPGRSLSCWYVDDVCRRLKTDVITGLQFALVYKNLVESYLLQDHEPELSALMFSIQVFTTPSVASLICFNSEFHANSLLTTILHLIYAFLTEQRTSPKQIKLIDSISNDIIDCESTSIRHKRYLTIVQDLKTLLTNEAVVDELPKRMDLLDDFIQFFIPFTDMNQFQRAVHEHVEYESDAWINAFNCTIQLTKVTNALGDLSSNFNPNQLVTLIKHILDGISETMHRPSFSTKLAGIQFGGHSYNVVDYSVAYEPVSFHHPLHWWLGNLLKHVQVLGHFYPGSVNTRELPLIFGERARNNLLPAVAFFEQPMRGMLIGFTFNFADIYLSLCICCSSSLWTVGSQWVFCSRSSTPLSRDHVQGQYL